MRITVILLIIALSTAAFAAPPASYVKNCQSCHGADGTPSAAGAKMGAPAFKDVQKLSDDQLSKAILTSEGHAKFPHNYSAKGLTADDAKQIVAFIRTLK